MRIGKREFRHRRRGVGGLLRFTFRAWVRNGHVEFDIRTRNHQFASMYEPEKP